MNNYWKAVLGIALVFILGFFSGVICVSIVAQHKARAYFQHPLVALTNEREKRLTKNLNLDPGQTQQIHNYFQQNLMQRQQLQEQIQPQVRMVNRETIQQIRAVLRPDQLGPFQKNLEEMRKNFAKGALNATAEDSPGSSVPLSGPATNSSTETPPTTQ